MNIIYKECCCFNKDDLEGLFLSVDWNSGKYPDKLVEAIKHYPTVYSAWDKNKLVGLICVMDDHVMNAYIHYLLVEPKYQGKGIGKKLVEMVKDKYKDYINLVLISYKESISFYEKYGFKESDDSLPMSL